MKVLLVNPPCSWRDRTELAPPLGLLSLKASLEQHDHSADIWDGNLEGLEEPQRTKRVWHERLINITKRTEAEVIGFSSMAVNSHVALEMAQIMKEVQPRISVILGGPHFSAIADAVTSSYPWVDYVTVGEGEGILPDLVDALASERRLHEKVLRSTSALTSRVNGIPDPGITGADHGRYFEMNPRRLINYESSRGCIFSCKFCYSPTHWLPRPRYREIHEVVEHFHYLRSIGAREVFFVDDNFVNDPRRAWTMSNALRPFSSSIRWSCYATVHQLTPELLACMAAGGCRRIFIGIDAVGEEAKRRLGKAFARSWEAVELVIDAAIAAGIVPTCAFIISPTTSMSDREETLRWAIGLRLKGCEVRLNPIAFYPGTRLTKEEVGQERKVVYSERRVRLMLDCSPLVRRNRLARAKPQHFPYHCCVGDETIWHDFLNRLAGFLVLLRHYPLSLEHLASHGVDLWQLGAGLGCQVGHRVSTRRVEAPSALVSAVGRDECWRAGAALAFEFGKRQLERELRYEEARSMRASQRKHYKAVFIPFYQTASGSRIEGEPLDCNGLMVYRVGGNVLGALTSMQSMSSKSRNVVSIANPLCRHLRTVQESNNGQEVGLSSSG